MVVLVVAGCGSAPRPKDRAQQLGLEQRLSSGDIGRLRAHVESDGRIGQVCGVVAASGSGAGVATRPSTIIAVLLIPAGARTVALEARGGVTRPGKVARATSARPEFSVGLVAFAGSTQKAWPAPSTFATHARGS
ncbi:MAG TPA: hypothetical protein VI318_26440 [Baekduia sp.]